MGRREVGVEGHVTLTDFLRKWPLKSQGPIGLRSSRERVKDGQWWQVESGRTYDQVFQWLTYSG